MVHCREKKNRPLKNPLKELVVVHTDKDFLADIEGDTNLHLIHVLLQLQLRSLTCMYFMAQSYVGCSNMKYSFDVSPLPVPCLCKPD